MPQPDNILIYRLGSLGDTVAALPCFHLVRRLYPHSKIFLLTNEPVSGKAAPAMTVLDGSGLCDEVISYPVGTRNASKLMRVRQAISQIRPQLLVNLAAGRGRVKTLRDYLFFRSCGVKKIVGTPWATWDLRVRLMPNGQFEPEAQRLARRLSTLGTIDLANRQFWDLRLKREERAQAAQLLQPDQGATMAVSVGTKLPVKDWGVDHWGKLLTMLSVEMPESTIVFLGAADEAARSEALSRTWAGPVKNLCGKISPRVSAAVLERCRLFIGHDSGPMHLASAVGVPTLGLFSWFNPPGQWFPGDRSWKFVRALYPQLPAGGWRTSLQMKRSDTEGIGLLQPEDVFNAAMELWNGEIILPALAVDGVLMKSEAE